MYKIPANTVFIGKRLVFVPECHSTNTLALQLAQKPVNAEGTVVITSNQTAGRGQHGNRWEASPGMNLTLSVILNTGFLAVEHQFYLTVMTSLAARDYIAARTDRPVHIKWPNDILVHEKKICGILIENQIQGGRLLSTIVGIGMNINQTLFTSELATSVRELTGVETDLQTALDDLLHCLESRFLQLRSGGAFSSLKKQYLECLYRLNEPHTFYTFGRELEGVIRDVDEDGKLVVETAARLQRFSAKEISFRRDSVPTDPNASN